MILYLSQTSSRLKDKCDRVNFILETVGLTHQGFLKLRDKYFEWQENTQNDENENINNNDIDDNNDNDIINNDNDIINNDNNNGGK